MKNSSIKVHINSEKNILLTRSNSDVLQIKHADNFNLPDDFQLNKYLRIHSNIKD